MTHYKFENPEPKEIKLDLSQEEKPVTFYCHWIVLLPSLIVILFTITITILLTLGSGLIQDIFALETTLIFTIAFTVFALGIAIASRNILYWQYRVYQVSKYKLIALQLVPWFNYEIEEMELGSIMHMESHTHGLVPKMISYKHITLADEMGKELQVRWVKNAHELIKKIQNNVEQINQEQ